LEEFWVVLQEGGTSGECYGEAYEIEKEAKQAVASHKRASYEATYVRVALRRGVTIEQAGEIAEGMAEAALAFRDLQESYGRGTVGLCLDRPVAVA
jgi:hypothetical protein